MSKVNRNSQQPVCTQQVAGCTGSFLLQFLEESLLLWSDMYLSLEKIFADASALCKAAVSCENKTVCLWVSLVFIRIAQAIKHVISGAELPVSSIEF